MHGINCDMMMWVYHKPELKPAFILANAGYDVWLGNNRGNRFSDPDEEDSFKDRWNFDWEDMGTKDVPSFIDYILN